MTCIEVLCYMFGWVFGHPRKWQNLNVPDRGGWLWRCRGSYKT